MIQFLISFLTSKVVIGYIVGLTAMSFAKELSIKQQLVPFVIGAAIIVLTFNL